jgi:hypothetical protein
MNKLVIVSAAAAAFAAGATPAFAQASVSQSTNGSATIIRPITLAKTSDIAFGKIVRPSTGTSTVTIDPTSGTRSISGGDGVLLSSTATRAAYNVGGEGGQSFSISVPASFALAHSGGSGPISVTLTGTATSGTLSGSLGADGTSSFGVGGSFDVSSSTATGTYSGTFTVTVQYN